MSCALHIGFGAFHKAHQAVYLQRLANAGLGDWLIMAINLRAADSAQFAIEAQKPSYEVQTLDEKGASETLTVNRHRQFFDWSLDREAAELALADAEVTFVTITVSEAGYYFDGDGQLDLQHPAIAAEFAVEANQTIYAYLREGLARRRAADAGPISILCCDNLRDNGKLLAQNFQTYLRLKKDAMLLKWVEENCTFPCSMVDRITPAPTTLAKSEDAAGTKIIAEDFIQWVIQDCMTAPRPNLEAVGVEFVEDVVPYEETKIRVLNGGHTAMAYLGALQGYETFDQIMGDQALLEHFRRFERVEVLRAMPADMAMDVPAYMDLIERRFGNQAIGDAITRICMDGFAKTGIYLRPTLEGCVAAGQIPAFTIRSIAAWFHYACLVKEGMRNYDYREPNWERLEPLLNREDPRAFLANQNLFGTVDEQHPEFAAEFKRQMTFVEQKWLA